MQIEIEGMSCMHCVHHVSQALETLPGLKNVEVEIGTARFDLESPASLEAVKSAVQEAGYRVI